MTLPRIQVLLSTYNGEKYLREQLESVLSQQGAELHLLIRDDGSKDGTVRILKEFTVASPEAVHYIAGENKGAKGSFFELIAESSPGMDYYAFCDQDDVWMEDKLQRAVALLKQAYQNQEEAIATNRGALPIPLVYCSSTQMVDPELNPIGIWPGEPQKTPTVYNSLVENIAVGCTMVMNRAAMELIKEHLPQHPERVIMHDWWVYLVISTFGEVVFDKMSSILYRQHESNVQGGQTEGWLMKWKSRYNSFKKGQLGNKFSKQAEEFLDCYGELLFNEHKQAIQVFLDTLSKNVWLRFFYAVRTPFYRHSTLDNLVLKIIYTLGQV
ncbi:hypothetical protein AWM70_16860 [Paenibacillus yonginensis]|uniref:Glycosyltransferase 2-like domain-containing protein n=1 Tax=Paenibacillus yonginensis TaxID=1462996 RepID=A0A1B1N3P3_9BACL|nr:glycosyltransferase family 2 protein [Paenibacillus yonginensis]ANS76044.1 hypothetical protein AWM70_16860 [Paenibacillus yonginensis]